MRYLSIIHLFILISVTSLSWVDYSFNFQFFNSFWEDFWNSSRHSHIPGHFNYLDCLENFGLCFRFWSKLFPLSVLLYDLYHHLFGILEQFPLKSSSSEFFSELKCYIHEFHMYLFLPMSPIKFAFYNFSFLQLLYFLKKCVKPSLLRITNLVLSILANFTNTVTRVVSIISWIIFLQLSHRIQSFLPYSIVFLGFFFSSLTIWFFTKYFHFISFYWMLYRNGTLNKTIFLMLYAVLLSIWMTHYLPNFIFPFP